MSEIQPFRFPVTGQVVRSVLLDGEPWFVGKDAATILAYANTRKAIKDHVPARHKGGNESFPLAELGLDPQTVLISEAGLYRLIMRSNTTFAEQFQDWVTDEVLPAIRRTGSYSVQPQFEIPRTYADALELAARQARAIDKANERIGELEPKASSWDVLASAHGDYSVREAAFVLNRDPAISTGQNRLFQTLRDLKLIDSRDIPYAAHERHVQLRSRSYKNPRTHEEQLTQQVRLTVDGLRYLHKKLGGTAPFSSLIGDAA